MAIAFRARAVAMTLLLSMAKRGSQKRQSAHSDTWFRGHLTYLSSMPVQSLLISPTAVKS